jgi:hypothetical protein
MQRQQGQLWRSNNYKDRLPRHQRVKRKICAPQSATIGLEMEALCLNNSYKRGEDGQGANTKLNIFAEFSETIIRINTTRTEDSTRILNEVMQGSPRGSISAPRDPATIGAKAFRSNKGRGGR